jgi:CheY-like chemotaxis protein
MEIRLKSLGYRVLSASAGPKALELAKETAIDLAVID